jgi:hypothetical protein
MSATLCPPAALRWARRPKGAFAHPTARAFSRFTFQTACLCACVSARQANAPPALFFGWPEQGPRCSQKNRGERSAGKRGGLRGLLGGRRGRPRRLRGVSFPLAIGERRLPALHLRRFWFAGPRFRVGADAKDAPYPDGFRRPLAPPRPAIQGSRSSCRRTGARDLPSAGLRGRPAGAASCSAFGTSPEDAPRPSRTRGR